MATRRKAERKRVANIVYRERGQRGGDKAWDSQMWEHDGRTLAWQALYRHFIRATVAVLVLYTNLCCRFMLRNGADFFDLATFDLSTE